MPSTPVTRPYLYNKTLNVATATGRIRIVDTVKYCKVFQIRLF